MAEHDVSKFIRTTVKKTAPRNDCHLVAVPPDDTHAYPMPRIPGVLFRGGLPGLYASKVLYPLESIIWVTIC